MDDEPVSGGIPGIGAGREQIHDDPCDGRILLKLVGADGCNLVGADADSPLVGFEARWQIDDQAIGVAEGLERGNQRAGHENFNRLTVFLLNDAKTLDGGHFAYSRGLSFGLRRSLGMESRSGEQEQREDGNCAQVRP
jgi:hypothetical protein